MSFARLPWQATRNSAQVASRTIRIASSLCVVLGRSSARPGNIGPPSSLFPLLLLLILALLRARNAKPAPRRTRQAPIYLLLPRSASVGQSPGRRTNGQSHPLRQAGSAAVPPLFELASVSPPVEAGVEDPAVLACVTAGVGAGVATATT